MPREHVDRAALAVDRVRRLDSDEPAQSLEMLDRGGDDARVALVEQAIDCSPAPSDGRLEAGADSCEQSATCRVGKAVEVPGFDRGNRRLADPGDPSEIDLPQPSPLPKKPKSAADTGVVHACIVATGRLLDAYPALKPESRARRGAPRRGPPVRRRPSRPRHPAKRRGCGWPRSACCRTR